MPIARGNVEKAKFRLWLARLEGDQSLSIPKPDFERLLTEDEKILYRERVKELATERKQRDKPAFLLDGDAATYWRKANRILEGLHRVSKAETIKRVNREAEAALEDFEALEPDEKGKFTVPNGQEALVLYKNVLDEELPVPICNGDCRPDLENVKRTAQIEMMYNVLDDRLEAVQERRSELPTRLRSLARSD